MNSRGQSLDDVLAEHDGVLATSLALRFMTESQLRWRVTSGRWQKPSRGVVVAQSGPLTGRQLLRAALLRSGPQAVLAGLTAARLDGFKGFDDKRPMGETPIYVLVPCGYKQRTPPLDLTVVTRYSRALTDLDVHPTRQPRRTRIARSLVDAAAWMPTDRGAMAILAAGVQQGLTRADDLRQVVRAFRLPEPSRQVARRDARGRRRWTDVMWDEYKVVVEIDGAQHTEDPVQRWDDMERDIGLSLGGYLTLRFPAWLIRTDPEYVARRVLEALRRAGYQAHPAGYRG